MWFEMFETLLACFPKEKRESDSVQDGWYKILANKVVRGF